MIPRHDSLGGDFLRLTSAVFCQNRTNSGFQRSVRSFAQSILIGSRSRRTNQLNNIRVTEFTPISAERSRRTCVHDDPARFPERSDPVVYQDTDQRLILCIYDQWADCKARHAVYDEQRRVVPPSMPSFASKKGYDTSAPTISPLSRAAHPVIFGGVISPEIPSEVHPRITRRICAKSTAHAMASGEFAIAYSTQWGGCLRLLRI